MEENTKPRGSALVLVLWILFCWPVAIIYACIRSWGGPSPEFQNMNYNSDDKKTALKNAFINGIISQEEYNIKIQELEENNKE